MPAELIEAIPATAALFKKRWTRAECQGLLAAGLHEFEHLELIGGELFDKRMSKNPPHIAVALLMHEWLVTAFGFRRVRHEAPIDVAPQDSPTNQPEPDLVVIRKPALHFPAGYPGPADLALVVEISDSTLSFDMNVKAPLYARAGIEEYWVLDLNARRLFVHREPADGKYRSIKIYAEHESVAPLAAPGSEFRVAAAFEE